MIDDRYSAAVAHLTAHPGEIQMTWDRYIDMPGGALFEPCGPWDPYATRICPFGCLTQVANGTAVSADRELTEAIRDDDVIPRKPGEVTVGMLEYMAHWRRVVDTVLNQQIPVAQAIANLRQAS